MILNFFSPLFLFACRKHVFFRGANMVLSIPKAFLSSFQSRASHISLSLSKSDIFFLDPSPYKSKTFCGSCPLLLLKSYYKNGVRSWPLNSGAYLTINLITERERERRRRGAHLPSGLSGTRHSGSKLQFLDSGSPPRVLREVGRLGSKIGWWEWVMCVPKDCHGAVWRDGKFGKRRLLWEWLVDPLFCVFVASVVDRQLMGARESCDLGALYNPCGDKLLMIRWDLDRTFPI